MSELLDTGRASSAVATFAHCAKRKEISTRFKDEEVSEIGHRLEYKNPYHKIQVFFRTLKNRDDIILVGAYNWKCEDEPSGAYDIVEARKFYKQLVSIGFTAF